MKTTACQRKELMRQIIQVPAVLYFPQEILGQLNQFRGTLGLSPKQLIAQAFRAREKNWEEFCEFILTPQKDDDEPWPEDPLFCLAAVAMLHIMRVFMDAVDDPPAFEQRRRDAPADWSFRALEDESDSADWWKAGK